MIKKVVNLSFAIWIAGAILALFIIDPYMDDIDGVRVIIGIVVVIVGIGVTIFAGMKWAYKKYKVSDEQLRCLLFGGLPITLNGESLTTFKLMWKSKKQAKNLLDMWDIHPRDAHDPTLDILKNLSNAKVHTDFADDVYNNLIKKGITDPSDEDLKLLKHENAQQVNRIKHGLKTYEKARKRLLSGGFTEEILDSIDTLAAWDYGRTAIVGRFGVRAKYIYEEEAWPSIITAAANASKDYDNWSQYWAAYVLGRAIAYGEAQRLYNTFTGKGIYGRVSFKM